MVNAAKVMAGLAVEALNDAALIARAKADLKARARGDALRLPDAGRGEAAAAAGNLTRGFA